MQADIARLCLGSATYTLQHEPQKIIDCAHEAGIRWLDTATTYQCEQEWHVPEGWNTVLKVLAGDIFVDRFYEDCAVLMAHEAKAEHFVQAMKAAGYKGKIGVSLYWPEARPRWAEVVQWPVNLADSRYIAKGIPGITAHKPEVTVFARSIFLQGKLLQMGYSVSDCLGYVLRQPVDYAVVGVNSVKEMEEIIRAAEALPEHVPEIPAPKLTDQELDPRTWSQG